MMLFVTNSSISHLTNCPVKLVVVVVVESVTQQISNLLLFEYLRQFANFRLVSNVKLD